VISIETEGRGAGAGKEKVWDYSNSYSGLGKRGGIGDIV